ncbi:hypothetical protein BZZ01_04795 [Nostocales cyanobacterium HT-58-2]|nr:hypothetical protein BZZ01_04795 [Nostocales cyanobacterium HT-58-2]
MPKRGSSQTRNSYGYHDRRVGTLNPIERFLIVCEGEKTEPCYFKKFRVPSKVKIYTYGTGENTINVVKKAIELRANDNYDQVWCVFDRDSFPKKDFNNALDLAQREKIEVAYSNESFELWYLLHFHYCDTAISRQDCIGKINQYFREHISCDYQKNSEKNYELLKTRQETAIRNAEKLLAQYSTPNPADDKPSTTVHRLVKRLNRSVL